MDVGAVKRRKDYYIREGGGFPWTQAVLNLVNPRSLVACLSTKGAINNVLTNLLIGLIQIWVNN